MQKNTIARFNQSTRLTALIYLLVFLFMLFCNVLTLKIADDYDYCFSWADNSRITSVWQIAPSMAAHAVSMNGRLIAHSIAQFFLMLPDWVFDVVNSAVFVLQLVMIVRICCGRKKSNLLIIGILCVIWRYELSFGQVNLWLDGSCNYLWNIALSLLFVQPYLNFFNNDAPQHGIIHNILFLFLSFIAGGYGETTSAAFIFIAVVLMILGCVCQKKNMSVILIFGLILASLGYLTIYMAPAQLDKGSGLTLSALYHSIVRCLEKLYSMRALILIFTVSMVLCVFKKMDKKRILLAGVFFLGAMCSNFILIFACDYPERAALGMTVLLIIADAILLHEIGQSVECRAVAVCVLAILLLLTPRRFLLGMEDVYQTYCGMKSNEEYLIQCAEDDIMDVELPIIYADLQYSAAWGLRYLSADDPDTWPNKNMGKYYGVDSIIGIK